MSEAGTWPSAEAIGILIVFLASFGEALPGIGLFIPATATILATATTAAIQGWLLWPLVLSSALGAWAGDQLAYVLGYRYRARILDIPFMRRQRRHVARAKLLLLRYGMWAVAFSRFVVGLRAIVPIMAGVFRMRQLPFQIGNVSSAVVWGVVHVLPGPLIAIVVEPLLGSPWFWPATIAVSLAVAAYAALRWRREGRLREGREG